jgi:hypothetical protein
MSQKGKEKKSHRTPYFLMKHLEWYAQLKNLRL